VDKILVTLSTHDLDTEVVDVRIGLGYTAVTLQNGSTGLSMTLREHATKGCTVLESTKPLSGRSVSELLGLIVSKDPIEAGIGLASANALVNRMRDEFQDGNIKEHLQLEAHDRVGMVGHFRPLVKEIKTQVRSLTVFEHIPQPEGDVLPATFAKDLLPECDVVLITATAIINQTMDELLLASKDCRIVAVVGASTPMLHEAFTDTPVCLLSGVVVNNGPEVQRIVSEGGGMRSFKLHVSRVNLFLKNK